MKRSNRVGGQFSPRLIEMLKSPAWRVASLLCRRVIERIEIELANHGGKDNGDLVVTKQDFVDYGICSCMVAPAIREAEALGFIRVKRGRGGNADERKPNKFFLTFRRCLEDSDGEPPHDWCKVKTIEEAEAIAAAARKVKDEQAVANGRRSHLRKRSQNACQKKQEPGRKNQPGPRSEKPTRKAKFPRSEKQPLAPGAQVGKTNQLSRTSSRRSPARAEYAPVAVAPPDAEPGRRLPEPGAITQLLPEDVADLSKRLAEIEPRFGKALAAVWLRKRIEKIAEIAPLASIKAEIERVKAAARSAEARR